MATQTISNSTGSATITTPVESVTVVASPPPTVPTTSDTSPALIPSIPLTTVPVGASATNPTSRGVNDISDIRPGVQNVSLPTRAEKRFIPVNTNAQAIQDTYDNSAVAEFASDLGVQQSNYVTDTDFFITAAKNKSITDYIKVRIPHRGVSPTTSLPDPNQDVEFRFLINPATVTVNRQTVDANSLTRGGWQFGVWGEDVFQVSLSGQSAGSYFTKGLTDEFSYYAVSYRNLMQLQQLFENNGYWFEGEEYNEGPLAPDYLRRRIRVHQDVELWCGNFIWSGMFDSLSISQDADRPFTLNFQIGFLVWKERYRSTSPYPNSILNNTQRGHSYSAVEAIAGPAQAQQQTNNTLSQYTPSSVSAQQSQLNSILAAFPQTKAPAVTCAAADDLSSTASTDTLDSIGVQPMDNLLNPQNNTAFWT